MHSNCVRRAAFAAVFSIVAAGNVSAATYYVDSTNGSDSNAGTSSAAAWKSLTKVNSASFSPGDSILFIRGGAWTGQLAPQGSGTSSAIISIDAYGSASSPLPLIQGGGAVSSAVQLTNQQYWDIKDLEITNTAGSAGTRVGVHIAGNNGTTLNHLHLIDLNVHNVTGDPANKETGGIFFDLSGGTPMAFNDVLIDGCFVHDNTRTGIIGPYPSWDRTSNTENWTPSTNVVIQNCTIANAQANGLIWRVAKAPLIQYNVFAGNGNGGSGNAMFVFDTDDAVIQYNEGYGTVYNSGDTDAAAFDADYSNNRVVIQYNYAHDNGLGGIVAVCDGSQPDGFDTSPVIRYNILQNNLQLGFGRISGNVTNAQIYNNTIYLKSSLSNIVIIEHKSWNAWPSGTSYTNNIFANYSSGASYTFGSSTNNTFGYNVFFNSAGAVASEPADAHKISSDPLLVAGGTGGTGTDTVDGYKLKSGSPALGSGKVIANNGGLDYWGNAVSSTAAPNRGAYNGSVSESQAAAPTFSPGGGTYTAVQSVTISTTTGGATIRYTIDGTTPSETNGTVYSGPVAINSTTELQAIAYETGFTDSTVTSADYTINLPQAAAPTFNPGGGSYTKAQSVAISTTTGGAVIRYTTNGSAPSETNGTVYSGPVSIGATTTLKAIAYESGFTDSNVSSATYTISSGSPITLEAENLTSTSSGPAIVVLTDANASGGKYVKLDSTAAGQYIQFTTTSIPAATYQLQLRYKSDPTRGQHKVTVDGAQVGGTIDQYTAGNTYPTATIGPVMFTSAGTHTIRLTVTGKNSAASSYTLSADSFILTPQ